MFYTYSARWRHGDRTEYASQNLRMLSPLLLRGLRSDRARTSRGAQLEGFGLKWAHASFIRRAPRRRRLFT